MSEDSYEILYFPTWGRVDVTKVILEFSGAQYKHIFVGFEVSKTCNIHKWTPFHLPLPPYRIGRL
jgi:hypothetical protein